MAACFCTDSAAFTASPVLRERDKVGDTFRSIGRLCFRADFGKLVAARSLMRGVCAERFLSGMVLPSLSECKACAVLTWCRDTARFCAFLHKYSLPLPLRFRCHCDLCLCLCADIGVFGLDLGSFWLGVLTRLMPSTLRSGLRL